MPIRFSTEAANADVIGDDAETSAPEGTPQAGAHARPRGRAGQAAERQRTSDEASRRPRPDEAKPGKDINAAGFVKDKDATKP